MGAQGICIEAQGLRRGYVLSWVEYMNTKWLYQKTTPPPKKNH